ncbi:hypothetical protein [Haloferula sp. A504]|uniref:hypothetical protein n=1 Tax=Haloferula sp. A504 TaxID=3373601 RepID=UPI0031C00239|nr:hypothetical protein [Verrucomicrobiaceae bacterium E54]
MKNQGFASYPADKIIRDIIARGDENKTVGPKLSMPPDAVVVEKPLQEAPHPVLSVLALCYWIPFGLWVVAQFPLPLGHTEVSRYAIRLGLSLLVLCGAGIATAIGFAGMHHILTNYGAMGHYGYLDSIFYYGRVGGYGAGLAAFAITATTVRFVVRARASTTPDKKGQQVGDGDA